MSKLRLTSINDKHGIVFEDNDGNHYTLDCCRQYTVNHSEYSHVEIDLKMYSTSGFLFSLTSLAEKLTSKELIDEVRKRGLLEVMRDSAKNK